MTAAITFHLNKATEAEIAGHLLQCDSSFVPSLSARVEIEPYAQKIARHAAQFEAWAEGQLIGLVAAYCNDESRRTAFVTSVSVLPGWQGKGVAMQLMAQLIDHVKRAGFGLIELEVALDNGSAIGLYKNHGFAVTTTNDLTAIMHLRIEKENK